MEFLTWHYKAGLQFFIRKWKNTLDWIVHYFSLSLLITSLFSSYKRLADDQKTGFNPNLYFQKLMFNFVSRGIGAVTRMTLFVLGMGLYFATGVSGVFGIILWCVFPVIGLPFYSKHQRHPKTLALKVRHELITHSDNQIKYLFDNPAGNFVLKHLDLKYSEVIENLKMPEINFSEFYPTTYADIFHKFIEDQAWPMEYFRKLGIISTDFLIASSWWDKKQLEIAEIEPLEHFGRPGIGLELLFGYTPTLNKFTADLSVKQSYSHHLIGREKVVARLERALTSGNSAMVIGTPGVGRKTVVMEFAIKAAQGLLGSQMAYRRVLEFDYNFLLSDTGDLNLKKSKLSAVLSEAAQAGNIILVIRDFHRLINQSVEGMDLTDIFEKFLEKRDLKIIGMSTRAEFDRFIAPNLRIMKFMDIVDIQPPTKEEAMLILVEAADLVEITKAKTIMVQSMRAILDGADRYISEIPFPEKALEILDAVVTYKGQNGGNIITPKDVNLILSERTGIAMSALDNRTKKQLVDLENLIHKELVNQEAAVSLIAQSLRSRTTGVREENRPVGSFLFLGPTGVGKTQTAKVLAKVYYESESSIIRFDMAEYATADGVARLIGSSTTSNPGVLTNAIRNKPASLLLLDEIEKAPSDVFNLLLTLLDEGYITDVQGRKIDCRHLFVIATSNAAAEFIREQVQNNVDPQSLQKIVLENIQKNGLFSPELLNRFDGVVVYEPLTSDKLVQVATLQLNELAKNLAKKNIFLEVTDEAAQKVAYDGFDPAFGARPMRRIVDLVLGDIIGKAILNGELSDGDTFQLIPGQDKNSYSIQKA
ncbi:MAG: clp protease ATP binding subunit [Candidatus Woesebacteria bacterium GW2011_GWB1_38_5b]|uniref:Clp protease ATP binding subunit n=1 Tax=Candidatus Woesebacteria bacterium GW2011_GWB1_38_5b TaxID=1618569 RepID=A0A0G0KI23_9BACT|nr:MAG: clp protease ATP binding subunit [Candidatus Woesebacteria bacterium GW2011_GWB1_38_5b]KKQ76865.1 MAG: clp protease ATP binding subunit [Parcubacteria group bacterium GW2011_GWA1_38_7]